MSQLTLLVRTLNFSLNVLRMSIISIKSSSTIRHVYSSKTHIFFMILLQILLDSLRYTYVTDGEEVPGQREIVVTASDGVFTDSLSLFVDVVIVNNNAPGLSFGGRDIATFVEGAASPSPIGTVTLL